jgi:hypothetical protein
MSSDGGGILPYQQTSATGSSYIGASGWPFKYINAIQHVAESSSNIDVGFVAQNSLNKASFIAGTSGYVGIYHSLIDKWAVAMDMSGSIYLRNHTMIFPVSGASGLRPSTDGELNLGRAEQKFAKVFATTGTIQTSDEREKDILADIDLRDYSDLFMDIKPIAFRWKTGIDNQIYFGVGAQTLERQFKKHGFDPTLYSIIAHDELEEPTPLGLTDRYSMNYEGIHMLTLMQTQKNSRDLELAVNRIKELEKKIMKLEQGIG